jgi:hypothetical protein
MSATSIGGLGATDFTDFEDSLFVVLCTEPSASPLCLTETPAQLAAQFFANRPDGVLGLDGSFNNNGVAVEGDTINNVAVLGQVLIPANNPTAVSARFVGGGAGANTCEYNGGGSGWSCTSNAAARVKPRHADLGNLLDHLAKLQIDTYQDKNTGQPVRNIGPTAEDFKAAFGFGRDGKMLESGNVEGVALAAAKGLYEKLQRDEAEIADLKQQLMQQRDVVEKLVALQTAGARVETTFRQAVAGRDGEGGGTGRPVASLRDGAKGNSQGAGEAY